MNHDVSYVPRGKGTRAVVNIIYETRGCSKAPKINPVFKSRFGAVDVNSSLHADSVLCKLKLQHIQDDTFECTELQIIPSLCSDDDSYLSGNSCEFQALAQHA